MKETKTAIRFFLAPSWEKEEKYLREQHKCGWEFVKLTKLCLYRFKKCEPTDVVYRLDYNEEGAPNKKAYVQKFEDRGWEYLQDCAGYSYFRKPSAEIDCAEKELFCDYESRMAMIKRVFNGRMRPLLIIFCLFIIPQIVMQILNPGAHSVAIFVVSCMCFVVYLSMFITFAKAYWNCRKEANRD